MKIGEQTVVKKTKVMFLVNLKVEGENYAIIGYGKGISKFSKVLKAVKIGDDIAKDNTVSVYKIFNLVYGDVNNLIADKTDEKIEVE